MGSFLHFSGKAFAGALLAIGAMLLPGGNRANAAALQPQVIRTAFPTGDVVIAARVVTAPRDGSGDAAAAIQSAIDETAAAGGGVVFLPAGRYRLATPLILKEGVTLRGDWLPPSRAESRNGTVLMPVADRGKADGTAAITLERGSGLREVTIWYPEQDPAQIVPYPWTLRASEKVNGDNYTVLNVTLVNPYQAIKVGPEGNELHTIRNVYGTPLKTGIWLDSTTDIGRLTNVDFRARWWESSGFPGAPITTEQRASLRSFIRREGIAVDMGRSDWEYLYRVRAEGYGIGMTVHQGKLGTTNAVMFGCELTDCGTALRLDKLNGVGLSVTGGQLSGSECAVYAPKSFNTVTQFNACDLVGTVRLEGPGLLTFQNCDFASGKEAAVDARAGRVSLVACRFTRPGVQVKLGADLRRARLLGNQFNGAPGIVNDAAAADVQISQLAVDSPRPNTAPISEPPDKRPATRRLFVVTDFGASVDAADNTAAFTRALAAAGKAGGGTVYVPAGRYRFAGNLMVPTGVELRGSFDVPHHTISGGSVLMPTGGRGQEKGTPFLRLATGSGARGLTIWYPEQDPNAVTPYPWAIQSTGPRCWLIDVNVGNAYQGVDFWSYPSTGHVIRYLSGGMLRRGLFVSKCDGEGWVEDVQFNPHYVLRVPAALPHAAYPPATGEALIDYERKNLEGIVFGRCAREHVRGTFLYASYDGIAFLDDQGGMNGRVLQHGTDASSRAAVLSATGKEGVELVEAQLVPLGKYEVGGIIATEDFRGRVSFFNSQIWAGTNTGTLDGKGEILLQQANTLSGGLTLQGSRCTVENVNFAADLTPHIRVTPQCAGAQLLANVTGGQFRIVNQAGERCYARMNSLSLIPTRDGDSFRTGWEAGEPQGLADTVAVPGGGQHAVSQGTCRVVTENAHSGKGALRLSGKVDDPSYAYIYFKVFDKPLYVNSDTVLTYWVRPLNELGRHVAVDLYFRDGSILRDSDTHSVDGIAAHPSVPKGAVGQWSKIVMPLGNHAGKVIDSIMVAYDSRNVNGTFEALFDDLSLESPDAGIPWRVSVQPASGAVPVGTRVTLTPQAGATIRYTLDGAVPGADSPRYEQPIVLDKPGLWEVRFAAQGADGRVSSRAAAVLYEVQAKK